MDSITRFSFYWSDESGKISQNFLVVCGVIMGSLASFINCLGLNLQKQSLCDVKVHLYSIF